MYELFSHSPYYSWLILPLLIFITRICDVSLSTLRIIFITRGKYIAPLIGFVEVFIWLMAISQIMAHLNRLEYYVAYAAGFAAGTFAGMFLESRLAIGMALVRVITPTDGVEILSRLKALGLRLTWFDARQLGQPVKIILAVVRRRQVREAVAAVRSSCPAAVYTIEDVRAVSQPSPAFLSPAKKPASDTLPSFQQADSSL